ncbi:MAG TPA: hypothetical protein PLB49_04800 [Chitinophagaceae bacterium]|nr:hypothetical protein [Chitinophagaceae bacterium]HPH31142.1 hypothetical protein [Chitinophagaceae bacterium]
MTVKSVSGQTYEPVDLAKKIFGNEKFKEIRKYSTGEYNGKPNGQNLQKGAQTKFRLLGQTDITAVVNMTIVDSAGNGFDTYLHFEKDTIWKLEAFRALAMTGMIEMGLKELEKMTSQQVDEIVAKSKDNDNDNAIFRSREDYYYELGNARLTLALDDTIVQHFLDNRLAFESLKDLAMLNLDSAIAGTKGRKSLFSEHKELYRKLFIRSVYLYEHKPAIVLDFFIGGMIDNTVGYFYTSDKSQLPKMTSRRYIMIREIGEGWYIYKTT